MDDNACHLTDSLRRESRKQPLTSFTMPPSKQEEQFSIAFIRAIASAAGYGVEQIVVDLDSVDLTIRQYAGDSDSYPQIDGLNVQLKCTYVHEPRDDGIHFPLKKKNYDDLRREYQNPRILVVVHVPRDLNDWLFHCPDSLALHYDAYWVSLRGFLAKDNFSTVTVTLPNTQRFTVSELKRIMNMLAQGKLP